MSGRPDVDPDGWSEVTPTRGGWHHWSPVTRSDDRWDDDPVGWAMPMACARHLRRAGAWMGAVAALGGALACLVLVVATWLLQAASSGSPTAAMRAGVLLFLAAQHGGVTLDGEVVRFVPLGLVALAAVLPWRAGRSLAALADDRGQRSGLRAAFVRLVAGYVAAVLVLVVVGRVGTSHAQALSTLGAGAVLVTVAAGLGVRRELGLRDGAGWWPPRVARLAAAVGAAALVLTSSSALLVAVSLVGHGGRVAQLSHEIGGGVAGLPLLAVGVASAPNAVVATASLLAGPGFAVGTDTVVTLGGARHGLLPSVPLLGALPDGSGPRPLVVVWAALTFLALGLAVARVLGRAPDVVTAVRRLVGVGLATAVLAGVAALLADGGLGSGRLRTVGPSPLWAGLALGGEVLVAAGLVTLVRAAAALARADRTDRAGRTDRAVGAAPAAAAVAPGLGTRVADGAPDLAADEPDVADELDVADGAVADVGVDEIDESDADERDADDVHAVAVADPTAEELARGA